MNAVNMSPRSFVAASALLLCASAMSAQNFPGKVHIYNAVQQMNSITPQAIAQQTIEIGAYDGSTNKFTFLLEPTAFGGYKSVEEGGDVPSRYVPMINSYNVKYEFRIANKPAGFGITVEVPDADGRMVEKEATISSSGTRASVTFNPKSFRSQAITIRRPGNDTVVRVHPELRSQLGAFVVPYQLITIIYEPPGLGAAPGTGSSSTFSQTSTANTVLTWDFARTSGMVQTVSTGGMYDMFGQAIGLGAGVILGKASDQAMLEALEAAAEGGASAAEAAGKQAQTAASAASIVGPAVNIIMGLAEQSTVTTTTTQTTGTTNTQGISISVGASYQTKLHRYPGSGDLFVVLHDVMYAYLAHGGRVYLAPIAYSGVDYYSAAELREKLPAVAEQYIALDPHLRTPPLYPATATTQVVAQGQSAIRAQVLRVAVPGSFAARFVPFGPYQHVSCKASGNPSIVLEREDFQSTGTTHTTTTTVVEHVTGLGALIGGGGDKVQGTTYSTAVQQGTSQTQSTSITLDCGSADQFWVDVYLDRVFRTFLTLRGEPIDPTPGAAPIAGAAQRPDGRRSARQLVRLRIGGETYVTQSDDNGDFAFPSRTLPKGSGQIEIGNERYNITYTGVPRTLMLKGGVVSEIKATNAPQPLAKPPAVIAPRKLPKRP